MTKSKKAPISRLFVATLAVLATGIALFALLAWERTAARRALTTQFDLIGLNDQGLVEYRHRQTGLVFVAVAGGEFMMGLSRHEKQEIQRFKPGFYDDKFLKPEEPAHEVSLSPFLIAKYEVSQEVWSAVMGTNPSVHRGDSALPVENIYMDDCIEFCEATGLDLPTEAQWEYACRAGTRTLFAFGDRLTEKQATISGWSNGPSSVTTNTPNGFGLYNMHGNVSEWCKDAFYKRFYETPESRRRDPVCAWRSNEHVIRGGCSADGPMWCRSSFRWGYDDSNETAFVGIRPIFNQ